MSHFPFRSLRPLYHHVRSNFYSQHGAFNFDESYLNSAMNHYSNSCGIWKKKNYERQTAFLIFKTKDEDHSVFTWNSGNWQDWQFSIFSPFTRGSRNTSSLASVDAAFAKVKHHCQYTYENAVITFTKNRLADSNLRQEDNYSTEFTGYQSVLCRNLHKLSASQGLLGYYRPMLPLTSRLTHIPHTYLFTARTILIQITWMEDRAISGIMNFAKISLSHEMKSLTRTLLSHVNMSRCI